MENKKKAKVDYAAIIREFEMYGRGRSLKQFCDDSSYVYPNVLRYIIRLDDEKFFLPVFDERFASIQVKLLEEHGHQVVYFDTNILVFLLDEKKSLDI